MLAKDFYSRCNIETRKLLKAYIVTMYNFGNSHSRMGNDYKPFYYDVENWSERALVLFYFLYFNIYFETDLGKILIEHGNLNLDDFKIPEKSKELIDDNYKSEFYLDFLEFSFSNYNAHATSLVTAYSNYDRTICLERILVNIFDNHIFEKQSILCRLFKINNELIDKLRKIAEEKEKYQPNDNFISNSSSLNISYGENITQKHFEYNPLIGRNNEFRNMCANLLDDETSVILHGKPGVGKTALIRGLAYRIQNGQAPKPLSNKTIVEINSSELVSGTQYVGLVEKRVLNIINSLLDKNVILFIDEIHTLMGLGQGENSNNDVSNILKPYLGDGRIKIIGATTTEEYCIINENGAFSRRFNGLEIPVLDSYNVLQILEATIERFKDTKGITFGGTSEEQEALLDLIIAFTNKEYNNYFIKKQLYNPDFALKILRSGYNFASLDGKTMVDVESLIEGVRCIDFITNSAKDSFENQAMSRTRKKSSRNTNVVPVKFD